MREIICAIALLVLVLVSANVANAKDGDDFTDLTYSPAKKIETLKVFIEGNGMDFDYVRRNTKFVDYVFDSKDADVHIMMTKTRTGGGGINYILNFYTTDFMQIGNMSLNCLSSPDDTDDDIRACILRTLKLGLMPYINETSNADAFDIDFVDSGEDEKEKTEAIDPWKSWVFRLTTNAGYYQEERLKNYNYSITGRGDKITENWRVRNSIHTSKRYKEVTKDAGLVVSDNLYNELTSSAVYSLSGRWSTGAFLSVYNSTYRNTKRSVNFKPAIEYNFFPWEESDKRIFTVGYNAGIEMIEYYETTMYEKDFEDLWEQSVEIKFELVQPWGEIETTISGANYLHDFSKNYLLFKSGLSLKVARGVSLNFSLSAKNVHNQLYISQEEITLEEILMGTKKLPSPYELRAGLGLRFQFGSIYNNVVNNRL